MDYTPAQTRYFLAAISRQEAEAHHAAVMAARMAQAGATPLKRYLAALLGKTPTEGAGQ